MIEKEVVILHYLSPKRAQKAMFYILRSHKPIIVRAILLIILLTALIIQNQNSGLEGLTFAIIILFIAFFAQYYRTIKITGKFVEQNSRFFQHVTYTFNNAFLKKEGLRFETTYNWDEIKQVKITDDFFLLYTGKLQTHIIDKQQLSPSQKNDLEEMLSNKFRT